MVLRGLNVEMYICLKKINNGCLKKKLEFYAQQGGFTTTTGIQNAEKLSIVNGQEDNFRKDENAGVKGNNIIRG